MTWIKICGITNLEDALMAANAGADALGFVFYEKSPRRVNLDTARTIVAELPKKVEKVGVFVDGGHSEEVAGQVGLTAIQLHVDSQSPQPTPEAKSSSPLKRYIALPVRWFLEEGNEFTDRMLGWHGFKPNAIFLDSSTPHQPGGTGTVFDWEKAAPLVAAMSAAVNIVVAGGLTPTNVAEAIRILKPSGVDVASGVEARPGKKDPEKVRAFIAAVRQTEKNA